MTIAAFTDNARFLSNFYPSPIEYDEITYPTLEHAYQAAKCRDEHKNVKVYIARLRTPAMAKRRGREIEMRPDWDHIKLGVMEELVRIKFSTEPLRGMLKATAGHDLIEGNTWGDTFWGVCRGKGHNHLGKILMKIRDEINH